MRRVTKKQATENNMQGSDTGQGMMANQLGMCRSQRSEHHLLSDFSGSKSSNTPRKNNKHDLLRELVAEIVTNMGYEGIPIVRIKSNKYLIGTEVQYL